MLLMRSLAFNVVFYINLTLWMLVASPLLVLPGATLWRVIGLWSRCNLVVLKWFAGISVELRGLQNLPDAPVIIAAKHQSAFETVCLLHLFGQPAFILKKELMRLPIFGRYLAKVDMVPVDRTGGQKALRAMVDKARDVLADGRKIVIFPEGTRRVPGAKPAYKHGIVHLYKELHVPVVPVALNSGLFWPRGGLKRYPGTIIVEFLPMIAADLSGKDFFSQVIEVIEDGSDRLLVEAVRASPGSPLPPEARQRIAELGAQAS